MIKDVVVLVWIIAMVAGATELLAAMADKYKRR